MSSQITSRLSDDLKKEGRHINLLWHGGEPMASGLNHFKTIFEPFIDNEYVTHIIQTNATIIDDEWCEFFRLHKFHIGVSIDGPQWANVNRVDRRGKETFDRVIKGIGYLKKHELDFVVIAVVNETNIKGVKELYQFFIDLGCSWLGINFEETECSNLREVIDNDSVSQFWENVFQEWYKNPVIEIREISSTLSWFQEIYDKEQFNLHEYSLDLLPSIAYNGDVVLLSPELLGGRSSMYDNFIVGNLLRQSVFEIEKQAANFLYVQEFSRGVLMCQEECEYFSFCRGGQASNKFYEKGRFDVTETSYCRNSKKRVVNAVMKQLNFK